MGGKVEIKTFIPKPARHEPVDGLGHVGDVLGHGELAGRWRELRVVFPKYAAGSAQKLKCLHDRQGIGVGGHVVSFGGPAGGAATLSDNTPSRVTLLWSVDRMIGIVTVGLVLCLDVETGCSEGLTTPVGLSSLGGLPGPRRWSRY
ncbi:MAG: hypothetical protein DRQ40_10265 [Gammaproteobacteria bacterium]|nr:MAG: hypothetical protein DRQ40_10265 [Gammaproteobacteria bacterium]